MYSAIMGGGGYIRLDHNAKAENCAVSPGVWDPRAAVFLLFRCKLHNAARDDVARVVVEAVAQRLGNAEYYSWDRSTLTIVVRVPAREQFLPLVRALRDFRIPVRGVRIFRAYAHANGVRDENGSVLPVGQERYSNLAE